VPDRKLTRILSQILEYNRLVILASLAGLTIVAWAYLLADSAKMKDVAGIMPSEMVRTSVVWSAEKLAMTFLMWSIMMVGMMLPSAAPAILLFSRMARSRTSVLGRVATTPVFVSGYLAIWTTFSLVATVLQIWMEQIRLLTPMLASASTDMTGGLLIMAGLYQWMPAKYACLEHCRSPLQHFLFHWKSGLSGAFRMGAEHGLFCLGCCWAVMLLLFIAGVMNLLWVATIAGFVLMEKLLPKGHMIGRLGGATMSLVGLWYIFQPDKLVP
jgi:predicted metal-binding membrane protein